MLHHLEMIGDSRAHGILAPRQLLHVPQLVLPTRQPPILALQIAALYPKCKTRPYAPAEIRRQLRLVDAYASICALDPVSLRQLAIRDFLDGMVDTDWWIRSGVVGLEGWAVVLGRRGVVGEEARGARVEAGGAVGEEGVCAESESNTSNNAEGTLRTRYPLELRWRRDRVHFCGERRLRVLGGRSAGLVELGPAPEFTWTVNPCHTQLYYVY